MKLEKIALDKIDVVPAFNFRDDFGVEETRDLEESMIETKGNIQPILVCIKDDRFELISGERRYRALKSINQLEALCLVYDNLTEAQKLQLLFNENIGRKQLTWQEELKCVKRLQQHGFTFDTKIIQDSQKISKQKVWSIFEALAAVEECPELFQEKTRQSCILKYKQIKRNQLGHIDNRELTFKQTIDSSTKSLKKIDSLVIDELKHEVSFYKEKIKSIYETIKSLNKTERLTNGVWFFKEVKQFVEASKTCELFGEINEKIKDCLLCKTETFDIYTKCKFYQDELKKDT